MMHAISFSSTLQGNRFWTHMGAHAFYHTWTSKPACHILHTWASAKHICSKQHMSSRSRSPANLVALVGGPRRGSSFCLARPMAAPPDLKSLEAYGRGRSKGRKSNTERDNNIPEMSIHGTIIDGCPIRLLNCISNAVHRRLRYRVGFALLIYC